MSNEKLSLVAAARVQTTAGLALVSAPVVTIEKYVEITGQEDGVVRGHIEKGYLPTIKIGKRRLVNLVALSVECLQKAAENTH